MRNNRRSSRLANKRRVDYNEDNSPIIDTNSSQAEILSTEIKLKKETVQTPEDVQDLTIIDNDNSQIIDIDLDQIEIPSTELYNLNEKTTQPAKDAQDQTIMNIDNSSDHQIQNEDSESSNKIVNLPQYINVENAPKKRRTKADRTNFQQASNTLSKLQSNLASNQSTIESFEACLKGNNKSIQDDNDNRDNNTMDIDEIYLIDDENNSTTECRNDDSHNVENSLGITQEDTEHSEVVVNTTNDKEHQSQQEQMNQAHQEQLDQSQKEQNLMEVDYQEPSKTQNPSVVQDSVVQDNNSKHDVDGEGESSRKKSKQVVLPRFTLKLSNDLKEAYRPGLPILTSLEDTEIIVYDSADPDFDKDDSIITVVENKQNMTITRKIRMTNETFLSSGSQNKSSISSQTKTYSQITENDLSSTKRTTEKQDTTSKIVCIGSEDESSKVVTKVQDSTSKKVPDIGITSQSTNPSTAKSEDIQKSDSVTKKKVDLSSSIEQRVQESRSIDTSKKHVEVESKNEPKVLENKKVSTESAESQISKGQNATVVGIEPSSALVQKSPVSSMSNHSNFIGFIKDQNSQRSDLTSANNLNETVKKNLNNNVSPPHRKKFNRKPIAKTNKAVAGSSSSHSISSSSIGDVRSTDSGDVLGSIFEMLNRRKIGVDETPPIPINIPNLADSPSNPQLVPMNLPFSSMSAEDHREYLQIESMIYYNPGLVSKEQVDFYQKMSLQVVNERKQFEQWQFERSKLILSHLNQQIENKVMDHLKYGRHCDTSHYSSVELTIGLNPAEPEEPELTFKQKLFSIGRSFEFSIPPAFNFPLEKDLWVDDISTISADSATKSYWQKTRTPVVSQDPLISTLLSNHLVDVVISSGGITALVGLAESVDVDLEIPIKIVNITKENSIFKTIYIDKPFVKKRLTPRDINQIYYNTAFESMTLIKTNDEDENNAELQRSSTNLEYSLWDIGNMKILIRCKSNRYFTELDRKTCTVGIKTKLDYQLDYNYESITKVEQARWWIYSLIRNKADLMLGRVNVPMNTLCAIEKVSTERILPDDTRVKMLNKKLHYILKHLHRSLPQGSYILRHDKGDLYATVYRSIEIADLQTPVNSQKINVRIDREAIPFVPLVWKGTKAQITGTFPIRIEMNPARKKVSYDYARGMLCNRIKCPIPHVQHEKLGPVLIDPRKRKKMEGCDDLQYIADYIIDPKLKKYDLDNMEESSGSSTPAPDFASLLNNFRK